MTYRVGVTGHRKLLVNYSVVFAKTLELLKTVQDKCKDQDIPFEVNTGMALGFDQLVCEACLELNIPYVAVVPCDNQDALWSLPQKQKYARLLEKASRVVVVNPGPYEAWKMHARNGWIVNNSDEMVVHWNRFYEGGTGNCMRLVNSKKLNWNNTV